MSCMYYFEYLQRFTPHGSVYNQVHSYRVFLLHETCKSIENGCGHVMIGNISKDLQFLRHFTMLSTS